MTEILENQFNTKSAYVHKEPPSSVMLAASPNGSGKIIEIAAVLDRDAYDTSTSYQQQALTVLSILMEEEEAKGNIERLIDKGYFMFFDNMEKGPGSQHTQGVNVFSVQYDDYSRNYVYDGDGHKTAASHVHIARHELRHAEQPSSGVETLAFSPLDFLRNSLWAEGDAQAEAVYFGFWHYREKDQSNILANLAYEKYEHNDSAEHAIEYYDNRGLVFSEDTLGSNIRANAFIGWLSGDDPMNVERLQRYVDRNLETYRGMYAYIKSKEIEISQDLQALSQDNTPDEERKQSIENIQKFQEEFTKLLEQDYQAFDFGDAPEMDYRYLSSFANRETASNYMDKTYKEHGDTFELLANGNREQLEKFIGVKIDPALLGELEALRDEVAMIHQNNAEKIEALKGASVFDVSVKDLTVTEHSQDATLSSATAKM